MRALRRHAGVGPSVAFMLLHQSAHALDVMEAIGAERCGRGVRSYQIDSWRLRMRPWRRKRRSWKVLAAKGPTDIREVTLSLDGNECTNGRCGFRRRKARPTASR